MARRIEIELTSARPDGTWTWRAAGALNPRGVLDASVLYDGAKVGDVVRAEAEFAMEGITVVCVEPPRAPQADDPSRIQLIERPVAAGVTTQLASRGRPDRGDRRHPGAGPRTGLPSERPARPESADRSERPTRDRGLRGPRPTSGPGRGPGRVPRGGDREPVPGEQAASEATAPRSGPARDRERPSGGGQTQGPQRAAARPKRLSIGNTHRNAMLEALPAEQRPIAQQLLRGGIPAVRTALHFERERAREEGRPEPSTEGVLSIAESLASRVKAAEWRDRAEAAVKAGDELAMRDLRSLVSGSDVARDEASRELVMALRESLEQRVEAHRTQWATEVAHQLDDGHVMRAVRLSSRPPDPAARFSAELATRLREAAGAALASSVPAERWLATLQAVSESPVRRAVKPAGLPENATAEQLDAARQQCGRVPGLAQLFGIPVPPPPGPARPVPAPNRGLARRPPRPPRPVGATGRPADGGRARPSPAPPPAPVPTPVAETPVAETPVAETPVAGEPVEAPVAEAPVAEAPVAEAPVAEAPVAEAPVATPGEDTSATLVPVTTAVDEVAGDAHAPSGEQASGSTMETDEALSGGTEESATGA